jgi:cephalosporin hydroxylase
VTTLEERYVEQLRTPSDIHLHLPTFVRLVENSGATKVIELGTRTGVSTIAWLYALELVGGHLWSVDTDERPAIGDHDHWTFIQGDDCSPQVFAQLPSPVDVVFIDTSHDYDHTLRELNLYRWLVRPGGKILLHDTELERPIGVKPQLPFPVKRAVETFCRSEGLTWENQTHCFGLGIVRLP